MEETRHFQAEVSRLLDIVVHSIYSDKRVFLRELVSNASDACDRRRYAALTEAGLGAANGEYRVILIPDAEAKTLTIEDNGIGMTHDELIENLGTIAKSGTAAFLGSLGKDAKRDVTMIGQFGVGFYSSFMVSSKVEVISRKAGAVEAFKWVSDGQGSFTIASAARDEVGTTIVLHLREGEEDYLSGARLRHVIKTYADHITLPVVLREEGKDEPLNSASALWTRPKSEITAEQYKAFYHSVSHNFDEPWLTLHWKAEGTIEYTGLIFVPTSKPFDLFDPARKHTVKLYVRRVFVTDDCQELVPSYLRFLKGIVDSEDLPLNISRETLQANPMLAKIRQGLVKRVLGDLAKKATDAPADYAAFWETFGAVLKEGLYEDFEQREALLNLARFRSTTEEGLTSLEAYVGRMKPNQKHIYIITGDNFEAASRSPQLEGFKAKGVEVLLLTDPVDEFWTSMVHKFKEFEFKSVTRGGADLEAIESAADADKKDVEPPANTSNLIALLKLTLGDAVKDVRSSVRLTDSAVCLVADEGDIDIHLQRLLRQHNRGDETAKRILEINPGHPLIRSLNDRVGHEGGTEALEDAAWLLLDQARIIEGESPTDPTAFAVRLAKSLQRSLGA